MRRAGAEVDRRDAGVRSASRIRADDGATNSSIVRRRERAHPRVEQLHGVGAGPGLRHRVGCERLGELARPGRARRPGSRYMSAFVTAKSRRRLALDEIAGDGERPAAEADDGLVGAQLRPDEPIASRIGATVSPGSGTCSRSTAAIVRDRLARRPGRRPRRARRRRPSPTTGVMMSANITAASTRWRRTGCSVTSAVSSADRLTSKNACRSRTARYSGSDRPAWRMNQTGVRSTGSRRAARTSSGSTPLD